MSHDLATPRTFGLAAGECRVLRAAAGSRWVAARGHVHLTEPPCWLGERIVSMACALRAGTEHVLERGGWITLHAVTDSTLICDAPASIVARLLAAWRIIRPGRALSVPA